MKPGQVLDARADLLDRLQHNNAFYEQQVFLLASQIGDTGSTPESIRRLDREAMITKHGKAVDTQINHLKVAEAYRVTEDMTSMVQFAASQLDDSDQIDTSLAPTQCGFVRFDAPLPVHDIRGHLMLVNWMTWGPYRGRDGTPVTVVWAFNDPHTNPDETHKEMLRLAREEGSPDHEEWYLRMIGRFATVGCDFLFNGNEVGPAEQQASPRQVLEVLSDGLEPLPGTNTVRYIHALWLLLNQTIVKVEEEEVDRPARRRAGKMKLPSRVTVIRLRRQESSHHRPEGESQVEWQHKWIVRGHWRWQPCGPHHPLAQEVEPGVYRARIWINPFVKGPEDKPFMQSEKLYSLDR